MEISVNLEDLFELISPENQPSPPASSIEERRLIALAVANDEEAFEGLIAMHQDSIFRFCIRWLRDVEDAREATQDTFVKAYFAIGRYRQKGKFSTWLYQIALNQCRDRLKSKDNRNRGQTDSLCELEPVASHCCRQLPPDQLVVRDNDRKILLEAIDNLPVKFRAVVILCGVEGMSQAESAAILKISPRAVEGRYYRAKKMLAVELDELKTP